MATFGSDSKAPESDALPDESERITGNDQPEGASAESADSAAGLEYADPIISALEDRQREYQEKCDNKYGAPSLGELKAVLSRGLGAYSSSHSPEVQSRVRWGLARVDQYLRLRCDGEPRNPAYRQDNDLLPADHPRGNDG